MEEKKDNLYLWNLVKETDPKHTKKANVKGNNITSIRPQYQIYNATKIWGLYGEKWGFKNIELGYELKEFGLVSFKAIFYYPDGEFEIINTISFWRDNAKTKLDDDFGKKVETDTLTKALSKLGFNADVFMGRFDDVRYVDQMNEKYKEKQKLTDDFFRENKSQFSSYYKKVGYDEFIKNYDASDKVIDFLKKLGDKNG